ncbi:3-carboxy-cis,cis-muconate cycloisomerase family FAD/NAD(P)-binding protein [Nocardia brasiliensis]|uniref:3-carboxy-cis,cis-muconate cycloisomerase family FAD/NAD(P)-binding protein n=1 Tax=Nocardia brasiliensis TaxID=37326 RepID=UPI001E3190FE|nr:3-carboxy-cis,cis-muconate cycloisomerase family FAD/NAD(P)-binding protein [Nocardia brasiliensis]
MAGTATAAALRIAIVGVGPRGLSVFERICANAGDDTDPVGVEVFLIDSTRVGTGAVWRTDQSPHLLMNTVAAQVTIFTDDTVEMDGPVDEGPSLYEWASFLTKLGNFAELPDPMYAEARALGPDTYPTRALYGHYLRWAYEHIRDLHANTVRANEITATALDVRDQNSGLQELELSTGARIRDLDAVVLTQGHLALIGADSDARSPAYEARRLGLTYVAPANAADVDTAEIPAGEPVLIRGLGLTFFDYLALLTVGRGGSFGRVGGRLEYLPSGAEPVILAGSRRGVPHRARGANQKGVEGRHEPVLLDPARIDELRKRAKRFGDVSFRRDVWPLVAREVESVYYSALIADRVSPRELRGFRARFLHAATEPAAAAILDGLGIGPGQRWDWAAVADPTRGRCFGSPVEFRHWLIDYLDLDAGDARQGNVSGPVPAALDVLRDIRNEVRLVVDHGGIAGGSYRDDLDRWYTPLNAFLSIGPPASRIAELAALIRADVVRVVGPGTRVRVDERSRRFVADSPQVANSRTTAGLLIDARLPDPDLRSTADPLLRNLLRRGEVRSYTLCDPDGGRYRTGGLEVAAASHAVRSAAGHAHPRRYALGVPTESVRWVTAAGPRPQVNSVTLSDADRIARAALAIDGRTRHCRSAERTCITLHDNGLLAPVRAGVPMRRLVSDDAWIAAMVDVELALVRAQARLGIVPAAAAQGIARAVRTYRFDADALAQAARDAANPVVAFVAELHRAVAAVDPAAADYVHRGSTSQDILDTATMLIAARAVAAVIDDLDGVIDALARLARAHRDTPIAGRTLGMHAVPTTFGAKVAVWMQGLLDARDRLSRVATSGLPVQLGGAAGTYASYVECARISDSGLAVAAPAEIYERLTAEFATELALTPAPVPWQTVRTPIADLAMALAVASGALGKFAVDVITQSRTEIAEVFEPAAAGRGESSAMPQKRNPVLATLIRSAALQVPALASILLGAMLAEDERPAGAWHAEWQPLRECLLLVGGAAHTAVELAEGLTADAARMKSNLATTQGQVLAERLALRLAPLLGKEAAKKVLQVAAFEAQQSGRSFSDVLAEDSAVRTHLSEQEVTELLRPETYLGAAAAFVDRVLNRL